MKNFIVLLALTSLFISNMAFAILDEGENSLGVYFDYDTFEQNCIDGILMIPTSMYFVMANCTQASIGGFEFAWEDDPTIIFVFGTIFTNGGTNFGDNYNFLVGFVTPLITGPASLLVEVSFLQVAPAAANISVGPSTPSSFGGLFAGFADGADPNILIPMNYATVDGINVVIDDDGWVRPGVGSIGCVGPVPNEEMSWGGVKALYR